MNRLTLIVPDLALRGGQAQDVPERYPHLERLIARGSWQLVYPATDTATAALRPWQRAVLDAAELDPRAEVLASAPVCARTVSPSAHGYWMHADLVHLVAGVERLELTALAAQELDADEREALRASMAASVSEVGYELRTTVGGEWLLYSERALDLTTYCAEFAMAVDMHTAMPRGRDAGALRRLLTELQMLLHEHPVNVSREARGLRTANGIWAWGAGTLPALTPRPQPRAPLPQAFSNDPFLQGLWQLFQHQIEPSATSGDDLVARCQAQTLAVARVSDLATLDTQWIAPLARALAAGRLSSLALVLDGWRLEVDRRALLRIWRRPRPLFEPLT